MHQFQSGWNTGYFNSVYIPGCKKIIGILTFLSRKNSILGLSEPKNEFLGIYILMTYEHLKFHAQLS